MLCYSRRMLDEAVRAVLATDIRVAYAYIFGSTARGQDTSWSDVDVAIGLTSGTSLSAYDIGSLTAALETATGRGVDLVLLDEATPPLAYRIFRDGRLIVEVDRRARIDREVRAILEYLDFKPVEEACARGVLAAAAHG